MTILRYCVYLALAIQCAPIRAEDAEMPNFSNKPTEYINRHVVEFADRSSSSLDDELLIGDVTNAQLKFRFWIVGANGHQCSASGIAKKRGRHYVYRTKVERNSYDSKCLDKELEKNAADKSNTENPYLKCSILIPATCVLQIELKAKKVILDDKGGICSEIYCGSRASIGKTLFVIKK